MQKINSDKKKNINGGISQAAIFGIIAAVGIGINIVTSVVTGVLNVEASKKRNSQEKATFNVNYQNQSSYVY